MRVVEVIPIVKGITRSSLSYFTKEKLPLGSFVRIPIKKGFVRGVVVGEKSVRESKTMLKKADFSLKKIALDKNNFKIPDALLSAGEKTARYYAGTVGSIIGTVTPKIYFENPELLGKSNKSKKVKAKEVKVLQLNDKDRFREYRGVVRESFARGVSTIFLVPNKEEVLIAKELLSLGIEQYVYTPTLAKPKDLRKYMQEMLDQRHPILIITTPSFLIFGRRDLKTFVLERESSRSYRTLARPFISFKTFLEFYTKELGANLILGDSILSLETLWREREGQYSELTPLSWRQTPQIRLDIVDMKEKKDFHVLSNELIRGVKEHLLVGKKVFLFGVRRGFAPSTICGDCASLLLCRNCRAPLVLHKDIYICHHCGAKRSTETRCDNCQSWKLAPLGIGVDRIFEECREIFQGTDIFILDKDHTNTKSKILETIKRFNESKHAILIGTEMALGYVKRAHFVGAVSLDPLFSVPDFYINEKIFGLVSHLRELALEHFLIQTRNAGSHVLKLASTGNILDFYRNEIVEREELSYPPFSIFIKVSVDGKEELVDKKALELKTIFGEYAPHFIKRKQAEKRVDTLSMILRIKKDEWPNQPLLNKLLLLTPDFLIKVDPESIL